jgi:signal transduction histidine kinase
MSVSIAFSVVIYRGMALEVERFAYLQRVRFERRFNDLGIPIPPSSTDREIIQDIKQHIVMVLVGINGVILIAMGGISYFLAGKTLAPIKEMIEEQNRFISDASHELRTPLTAMKSSLEVYLRDPKLTLTDAKEVLTENIEEVNRLALLSESLLTLSENQNGNTRALFKHIDIKHIIDKSVRQVKHNASQKKIAIKTDSVPQKKIYGNEEKLIELFTILLDNAIKYSPEESVILLSGTSHKKYMELRVEDKGIGIEEKDIPHVFDRFYRSDSARSKTGAGGYGLGLSIAKKIVALHSGSIRIESIVHFGTTVIVQLPLTSA